MWEIMPYRETKEQNPVENTKKSLEDLHNMIEQQGWVVYEVQKWDTLWDIVKKKFWLKKDSEIANSIIKISKINYMNNTIKKDTLSVVDWKTISQPDWIPWDLIIAGEKIILKLQEKQKPLDNIDIPPKPSAKEFLGDLKKSNPDMFRKLELKFYSSKTFISSYKNLEDYVEKELRPIYFSPSKNEIWFIESTDGLPLITDYKTHENYALLSSGEVVEYTFMWWWVESVEDRQFLWYGIFWKHNDLTK